MGKPGRVLDATNVSKTVVKALEMDAEGDVFIGASGHALALVATHLSPLVKRYWRNRYRRALWRAGGDEPLRPGGPGRQPHQTHPPKEREDREGGERTTPAPPLSQDRRPETPP